MADLLATVHAAAKPAIATVALLTFVERWDDYLGRLIFVTSHDNATVSPGLSLTGLK
jgi:ABC-type glycerol-3-phosphate transport system permease component